MLAGSTGLVGYMFRVAKTYVVSEKKYTSIRVAAANDHEDDNASNWRYT